MITLTLVTGCLPWPDKQADERAGLAAHLSRFVTEQASPSWALAENEVQLMGLAGWQYREFFSVLLPLYKRIGVYGAAELLRSMEADSRKSAAIVRLHELYQNEDLMDHMPMEL